MGRSQEAATFATKFCHNLDLKIQKKTKQQHSSMEIALIESGCDMNVRKKKLLKDKFQQDIQKVLGAQPRPLNFTLSKESLDRTRGNSAGILDF